jgi:hypothetical protein
MGSIYPKQLDSLGTYPGLAACTRLYVSLRPGILKARLAEAISVFHCRDNRKFW